MWTFAWQNLVSRPSRTALAVVGLTIPVLAFLGLFSVTRGIRDLIGNTLGKIQGLMVMRDNSPSPVFSELPADFAKKLREVRGARVVAPEIWKIAPPINGAGGLATFALGLISRPRGEGLKRLANPVLIEGQDLPTHLQLKSAVFAQSLLPPHRGGGRFLTVDDAGKPNIVISAKIASEFPNADKTPKRVGQTLQIGQKNFTIVGIYETSSVLTDMTVVMDIETARKLLGVPDDTVSTFDVEPIDIADTDALAERIESKLSEVQAQRISQFNLTVGAIMGKLELFLLLAIGLATTVGAVGIANTMLMSTSERYLEFGVMRTNGWTRRNILGLVTTESALLGLLSGAIGCVLAVVVVLTVNRFITGFELDLTGSLIGAAIAGAIAIATLSGLYPALRASRMTPMDAIRRSAA
jgi:putative ABC transport system permease protein